MFVLALCNYALKVSHSTHFSIYNRTRQHPQADMLADMERVLSDNRLSSI